MQNHCQMDGCEEKRGWRQNDKLRHELGRPAPEPEGIGSSEHWSVETLPEGTRFTSGGLPSFIEKIK